MSWHGRPRSLAELRPLIQRNGNRRRIAVTLLTTWATLDRAQGSGLFPLRTPAIAGRSRYEK